MVWPAGPAPCPRCPGKGLLQTPLTPKAPMGHTHRLASTFCAWIDASRVVTALRVTEPWTPAPCSRTGRCLKNHVLEKVYFISNGLVC